MARSFIVMPLDGLPHADLDPDGTGGENFTLDWTQWLAGAGETSISSCTVTPETGITAVGSCAVTGALTTQVLKGGVRGQSYRATYQITTLPNSRTPSQTIVIDVRDQ